MAVEKCLDTYALIEIYLENKKFAKYLDANFVVTDLTLAEFFGVLLRKYGKEEAYFWFRKLEGYSAPANREILIEAIKFRHEHKRQNISFFDSVGYIFSMKKRVPFVTGDKEFEKFDNVEFVKK